MRVLSEHKDPARSENQSQHALDYPTTGTNVCAGQDGRRWRSPRRVLQHDQSHQGKQWRNI